MTTGRYSRRPPAKKAPPISAPAPTGNLVWSAILVASLVLHLVVGALVLGGMNFGRFDRIPMATLSVELLAAPVLAPQRGDGGSVEPIAAKAPPTPAVKPLAPPAVKPRNEVAVAAKDKKPLKAKPKVDDESDLRKSLAEMRQRQQDKKAQADAADTIAQMRKTQADKAKAAAAKPRAGTPDGTGAEAGGAISAWITAELQKKWNLSKYQLTRFDLVTKVGIEYDKSGKLVRFELKSRSGNKVFDDSILKALKAFSDERLPASYVKNLKGNYSQEITLTPKDLQD